MVGTRNTRRRMVPNRPKERQDFRQAHLQTVHRLKRANIKDARPILHSPEMKLCRSTMRIARQCRQYARYRRTPQQRQEHRDYLKKIKLPPLTNHATDATKGQ